MRRFTAALLGSLVLAGTAQAAPAEAPARVFTDAASDVVRLTSSREAGVPTIEPTDRVVGDLRKLQVRYLPTAVEVTVKAKDLAWSEPVVQFVVNLRWSDGSQFEYADVGVTLRKGKPGAKVTWSLGACGGITPRADFAKNTHAGPHSPELRGEAPVHPVQHRPLLPAASA